MNYLYPCTGNISYVGFGEYFEKNIQEPRHNINLFASELKGKYGIKYVSLVNSGSSANLCAALVLAEKIKKVATDTFFVGIHQTLSDM